MTSSGASNRCNWSNRWTVALVLGLVTLFAEANGQNGKFMDANKGFVFSRRRFDPNFLPLMRNFFKANPNHEIQLNVTKADGKTKSDKNYYINPNVDYSKVTEDDLILEALDQAYQSRFMQPWVQTYHKPEDRRRSSDPKKVSPKVCQKELNILAKELEISQKHSRAMNPELANFFDSYGTEPSGLLLGHTFWMGNWRLCNKRHIFSLKPQAKLLDNKDEGQILTEEASFTGRYCVLGLKAPDWDKKIESKVRQLEEISYFKYANQSDLYRTYFRLQIGVCLPESCDSTLLMNETLMKLVKRLALYKTRANFHKYETMDLFCLPDPNSELQKPDASGQLLISLVSVWLLLIVVATVAFWRNLCQVQQSMFKSIHERTVMQKLILGMSLQESLRALHTVRRRPREQPAPASASVEQKSLAKGAAEQEATKSEEPETSASLIGSKEKPTKEKPVADKSSTTNKQVTIFVKPSTHDLAFLDAVKVFLMPYVLMSHTAMVTDLASPEPLQYDTTLNLYLHMILNTVFVVDWFFVVTATVTAYASFASNAVAYQRVPHWIYGLVHRYWRLMPPYLLSFWFGRSLFRLLGEGPIWDYGTAQHGWRAVCRAESWWYPLTLTQNLHPIHRSCIIPSWYMGVDMQLAFLAPPFLVLLHKKPKLGWLTSIAAIGFGLALRAHKYITDPAYRPYELLRPRLDAIMRNNYDQPATYLHPQYRFGPYLMGLLIGHYMFMVRSGKWKSPLYKPPGQQVQRAANEKGSGKKQQAGERRGLLDRITSGQLQALSMLLGIYIGAEMLVATIRTESNFYLPDSEQTARFFIALGYGTCHVVASLAPVFLFPALCFCEWRWLTRLLEKPFWTILSRLNFFVFLLQVELIFWVMLSTYKFPDMNLFEHICLNLWLLPALYVISWLMTVFLANPLFKLEREFLGAFIERTFPLNRPQEVAAK